VSGEGEREAATKRHAIYSNLFGKRAPATAAPAGIKPANLRLGEECDANSESGEEDDGVAPLRLNMRHVRVFALPGDAQALTDAEALTA
jgi:hypothetical protein